MNKLDLMIRIQQLESDLHAMKESMDELKKEFLDTEPDGTVETLNEHLKLARLMKSHNEAIESIESDIERLTKKLKDID